MKNLRVLRTVLLAAFVFLASFAGQCGSSDDLCLACPLEVRVVAEVLLSEAEAGQSGQREVRWHFDGSVSIFPLGRTQDSEGDRIVFRTAGRGEPPAPSEHVLEFRGIDLDTLSGRLLVSEGPMFRDMPGQRGTDAVLVQTFPVGAADLADDGTLTVCWQSRRLRAGSC